MHSMHIGFGADMFLRMTPDWNQIRKEVKFTAVRSRGPGGQNVNKVSSAALLTWSFRDSLGLSEAQKHRLRAKLVNQINSENEIYLRSDESRDLERNRDRCFEKLCEMVDKALYVPPPRIKTKPSRAAKRKRVDGKTKRGDIKKLRQKVRY